MAVVDPANDGFITVYPCLETPPRSSSLNYTADVTSANEIVATLDGNGHVCVFARTTIDVIADVVAVTR